MASKSAKTAPPGAAASRKQRKARSKVAEELLETIVAKKTFKQLAGYAITVLDKTLAKGKMGAETHARAALEHGGGPAVLGVLLNFPHDSELVKFGLSALKSMHAGVGASASSDTVGSSVRLLEAVWSGEGGAALGDPERAADVLDFMLALLRKRSQAAAMLRTNVLAVVQGMLECVGREGKGGGGGGLGGGGSGGPGGGAGGHLLLRPPPARAGGVP